MEVCNDAINTIIDIVSKATQSKTYKNVCQEYIAKQNSIPPPVLDFWWMGTPTHKEAYNDQFLVFMRQKLSQSIEAPTYLDPKTAFGSSPPEKLTMELFPAGQTTFWNWKSESENDPDFYKYFPKVDELTSAALHAFWSQAAFDEDLFKQKNEFGLHLSVQGPVNNRDFNQNFATSAGYNEDEKKTFGNYSMYEYVTNQGNTTSTTDNQFNLSNGHYILTRRVRREEVEDEKLRELLAPYTHMMEIVSSDTSTKTRKVGVKTLEDHVGIACDYKSMCDFFHILTVSSIYL
jgi:hypothetical protein